MMVVLLFFILNMSASREWVLSRPLHGDSKHFSKPKTYEKGSLEYKILQLALDIESILPTKVYDKKYQKRFMELIPVPKSMHKNFLKRQALYDKVAEYKRRLLLKESDGFLTISDNATSDAKGVAEKENNLRRELYALIASFFKLKNNDDIKKIPSVYGSAIVNLRYYVMLTREPSKSTNSDVLASMTTSYSYNSVLENLNKFLEKNHYIKKPKLNGTEFSAFDVVYKNCKDSSINFKLFVCKVKNTRPVCKEPKAKKLLEGLMVNNGVLLWVEKSSKEPTIKQSIDKTEDRVVVFCKDHPFNLFDEFSKYLIREKKKH